MTLSEIENILIDLSKRHTNLGKELLTTILLSAGWEEKSIKEALVLFDNLQKRKEVISTSPVVQTPTSASTGSSLSVVLNEMTASTPSPKEDITFYKTDGEEEGELHVFEETSLSPQKDIPPPTKEIEIEVTFKEQGLTTSIEELATPLSVVTEVKPAEVTQGVTATEPITQVVKEEVAPLEEVDIQKDKESLIIHEVIITDVKRVVDEEKIPNNLPLLPFESSPHVWSFSRYKDVFHGEGIPDKVEQKNLQVSSTPEHDIQKHLMEDVSLEDEIVVEKMPLNKEDESLVFLAGVMLLGIILILGYMYNNGRL